MWGEPSPYNATVEMSYLAFARFTWDPDLTWDRFVAEEMAPRLGGDEAAARFIALAEEIDANQRLPAERLAEMRADALSRAGAPDDSGRRWLSLADQIGRQLYMGSYARGAAPDPGIFASTQRTCAAFLTGRRAARRSRAAMASMARCPGG